MTPLINQLTQYALKWPEEQSVVSRFVDLLQAYPNAFERTCWAGHITGSAWVTNPTGQSVLLTHHRKLDMWLQLGGHSDGDPDTLGVALREAREESGLLISAPPEVSIFDIDIHGIPARKEDPAHYHFDVRYALQAQNETYVVSEESMALAWVEIERLHEVTEESSIMRMRHKWQTR